MNAKELRAAACRYTALCDSADDYAKACPEMYDGWQMAKHILAAVRDDDDEPLDSTFLLSVGAITFDNQIYWLDFTWGLRLNCGAWISVGTDTEVKTRGQLRRLCNGLGIELKEVGSVQKCV